MRVERLSEDDWPRLRAVRIAALEDSPDAFGTSLMEVVKWSPEHWRIQLRVLRTFVAVVNDEDRGMVRTAAHSEREDSAWLISMWVSPNHRRGGLGRSLVDAVTAWALDDGRSSVLLDVRTHATGAIAFYEALGFEATGEITREPPPMDHLTEARYRLRL